MESMRNRRTIRKYTDEALNDQEIRELLLAAMYAPSAWGKKSWEFMVVDDPQIRRELGTLTPYSAQAAQAPVAIIVMSDTKVSSSWIEDASVAAEHINLQAAKMGLGSSWVQVRGMHHGAMDAEQHVKEFLGIPENYGVCCIITVGHAAEDKPPHREADFEEEKVHYNRFGGKREMAA